MVTRCIRRERWSSFAEELIGRHRGWIVQMEIFDSSRGIRQHADRSPLHEVMIDMRDDEGTLFLSVGDDTGRLSHWVNRLRSVWFESTDDGLPGALEIETEFGERTIVRFERVPPSRQLH
ncbi:MAG: DUF5335 family protein [Thermoanaerobaculia bacterium]|nr:DUF5335 family protein [Thermoanaerobaculia bacterium]